MIKKTLLLIKTLLSIETFRFDHIVGQWELMWFKTRKNTEYMNNCEWENLMFWVRVNTLTKLWVSEREILSNLILLTTCEWVKKSETASVLDDWGKNNACNFVRELEENWNWVLILNLRGARSRLVVQFLVSSSLRRVACGFSALKHECAVSI